MIKYEEEFIAYLFEKNVILYRYLICVQIAYLKWKLKRVNK